MNNKLKEESHSEWKIVSHGYRVNNDIDKGGNSSNEKIYLIDLIY